jgi:hypothetical protein
LNDLPEVSLLLEADERLDERLEQPPPACLFLEFPKRLIGRHRALVGSFGRQRVIDVHDTEDPGQQRDGVAGEVVWIAGPIWTLVMVADDRTHVVQ